MAFLVKRIGIAMMNEMAVFILYTESCIQCCSCQYDLVLITKVTFADVITDDSAGKRNDEYICKRFLYECMRAPFKHATWLAERGYEMKVAVASKEIKRRDVKGMKWSKN
jgi:hypothetical protein